MNEFFNNATTVTVGEGFTAFECVTAKFNTDYSASYRDGNSQRTKKWVKGDTIQGYLIQDKLNKYVRTGVNNICPKSGDTIINVPANNSTIITILPQQKPPVTSGGNCVKLVFKKDYEATFGEEFNNVGAVISEQKGKWLKGDLINARIFKTNSGGFAARTTIQGNCPKEGLVGEAWIYIAETDAEMKALFGEISDDMIQTMDVRQGQPLRDITLVGANEAGTTTIKLNKTGVYVLAGIFVLIGLMLVSKK